MKRIIFTLLLLAALPAKLPAAEVKNLKVGQSGDKGFATFDLRGEVGEREAEVTVSLIIAGRKYEADRLTLTGDFGKKVKTGVGKHIVWDILADISSGFDGEVIWNVDAASTGSSFVKATPGNSPVQSPTPPPASKPAPAQAKETAPVTGDFPFEFSELVARDKNTGTLWLRTVSKNGNGHDYNKARGIAIRLASDKFAGCADWKLPTADHVTKIVGYALEAGYSGKKGRGYPADYFNTIGFKGVANDYYWTLLGDPKNPGIHTHRVAVDLEDGIATVKPVMDYLQVWPICKPD